VFFRNLVRAKGRLVAPVTQTTAYTDFPVPPLPSQKEAADA
jgi:hypothetical protein